MCLQKSSLERRCYLPRRFNLRVQFFLCMKAFCALKIAIQSIQALAKQNRFASLRTQNQQIATEVNICVWLLKLTIIFNNFSSSKNNVGISLFRGRGNYNVYQRC